MPSDSSPTRLTRATVLAAALALVDEEGAAALTMRALADRLGVVPMALYRHVRNKDDLLDGVVDLATSQVVIPDDRLDWRDGLAALARSLRATMLAHPEIAARVIDRPSLGPAALRIGEYGIGRLRTAGFADADAEHGANLVVVYALGFAALEVPRRAGDEAEHERGARLRDAYATLSRDEFPHTAALRPSPLGLVSEEQFDFGLDCLLDGIAARRPGD
jgi:AcrR family transcriptional regulator